MQCASLAYGELDSPGFNNDLDITRWSLPVKPQKS